MRCLTHCLWFKDVSHVVENSKHISGKAKLKVGLFHVFFSFARNEMVEERKYISYFSIYPITHAGPRCNICLCCCKKIAFYREYTLQMDLQDPSFGSQICHVIGAITLN